MKLTGTFLLTVLFVVGQCKDEKEKAESDLLLLEVELNPEHLKTKRQAEQGRSIGNTEHIYGAAPGHYVLRTKNAESQQEADYLNILRQIESGALQQSAARPAIQQYVIPRQPQPTYAGPEQKVLHVQTSQVKRPVYAQNQVNVQPTYQTARVPLVLRPSQAVRPSPVQGIYTNQGFVGTGGGHALHEARVQAALSVADDKQLVGTSQSVFQFSKPQPTPLGESTFEKELAQLVAANQAAELKAQPQIKPQAQAYQYVQIPQKPIFQQQQPPKAKQFSVIRPDAQAPKYLAPIVAKNKAKQPQKLPQQYLIETSKPQQAQLRQPQPKPQLQYQLVSTEEPKYYDIPQYQERNSPMKIVAAPQLQNLAEQYKYIQKEVTETAAPAYLQYYQTIKPQTEEITAANDVKINPYVARFAVAKPLTSAASPAEEQIAYIPKYQTQPKADNYVAYKAAKPQLTAQYSSEEDQFIQALIAQSLQKSQQGFTGFQATKPTISETRPQPTATPLAGTSQSSIFVSKAIVPKKKISQPQPEESNAEEDVETIRLPPPKNSKVYTQEEFQALVAAGYSVTPVPVADDDESKGTFDLAPENYPGHSKFRATYVTAEPPKSYQKVTENYAEATQAPRTRKVQRRRPSQKYRAQSEDTQAESESQSKLTYSLPLETEETVRYGMRKVKRNRPSHDEESES